MAEGVSPRQPGAPLLILPQRGEGNGWCDHEGSAPRVVVVWWLARRWGFAHAGVGLCSKLTGHLVDAMLLAVVGVINRSINEGGKR